ncbi:hypothetical protein EC957_009398 [Mortierella hygrophila]|uniref:Chitin-binding type-4 domain-containing protein n=1 Tax=Mortierella hygrophila TaxID=979708 RepID=A0A9P6FAG1_9FUNG|nr:hypothetical protein EC957_009398 [Mortierella hygrophila]
MQCSRVCVAAVVMVAWDGVRWVIILILTRHDFDFDVLDTGYNVRSACGILWVVLEPGSISIEYVRIQVFLAGKVIVLIVTGLSKLLCPRSKLMADFSFGASIGERHLDEGDPGGELCIRWPAKNHAIPSEKNQPVTIALSKVNPQKDPTQLQFLDNIIAKLNYKNCTDKGKDTDIWPCGGCFKLPTNLKPGNVVLQWRWKLNSNEFYTSCADLKIEALSITAPTVGIPSKTTSTSQTPTSASSSPSDSHTPTLASSAPSASPISTSPSPIAIPF